MIYAALILFALAAILGLYLISFVLRQKATPKPVAFIHGGLAATGLVLLIIHTVKTGADLVQAIVLFVIAALGGVVLIVRDLGGKSVPKWLAVIHGLLAIAGFIFLVIYALNKQP